VIADRLEPVRVWISRRGLSTGVAIAALLVIGLTASLWTTLQTSSGALVPAWCAAWSVGVGIAGWHLRTWFWSGLCTAAMLRLVLLWVTLFAHTSWTSAVIKVLGARLAVVAVIGAVLGTWLGKRRRSQG